MRGDGIGHKSHRKRAVAKGGRHRGRLIRPTCRWLATSRHKISHEIRKTVDSSRAINVKRKRGRAFKHESTGSKKHVGKKARANAQ